MAEQQASRRLLIVRHAEAARERPGGGPDHDRPLNERGEHQARLAGDRLQARGLALDLIVCSTAARALGTARILADCLGYDGDAIQQEHAIYNASRGTLLELLSDTDDRFLNVAIVAHNPGLSELASALSREPVAGLPTCGIVSLMLPTVEEWAALRPGRGQLEFIDNG